MSKLYCDFKGCKVNPEVTTSFSNFSPYSATKLMEKIVGKEFCEEHAKEIQAQLLEEVKSIIIVAPKEDTETE